MTGDDLEWFQEAEKLQNADRQMSEALSQVYFWQCPADFRDAYTYFTRD